MANKYIITFRKFKENCIYNVYDYENQKSCVQIHNFECLCKEKLCPVLKECKEVGEG
jgi:hypothetical protein